MVSCSVRFKFSFWRRNWSGVIPFSCLFVADNGRVQNLLGDLQQRTFRHDVNISHKAGVQHSQKCAYMFNAQRRMEQRHHFINVFVIGQFISGMSSKDSSILTPTAALVLDASDTLRTLSSDTATCFRLPLSSS